MKSAVQIS